ncbi:EPT/RTPC-like protein [Hypomontagnella monticulosa]|nr:EPT/RTPC-like protein [Hypomontagnella monticulosa]
MESKPLLLLDGRTGEGGGQLVRIACALAAVTSQPIRIEHVRGNRARQRGGGLKAQHLSAIQWLAEATGAQVEGLRVGSSSVEFRPNLPPTALQGRTFSIVAGNTASSTSLILQAILPFLLFAGHEDDSPIELDILGGTNVSFSPSYEYLDQVLLPALQNSFGIVVERQLKKRAWALGPLRRGCIWLKFQPLSPGQSLKLQQPWDKPTTAEDFRIRKIDITIIAPQILREHLEKALTSDIGRLFPNVDVDIVINKESGHDARMYTLLVAHSQTGLRWGRDCLYGKGWKKKKPEDLGAEISQQVCKELFQEIKMRGTVDEHLQDQLVVFQALAQGKTSFPRGVQRANTDEKGNRVTDVASLTSSLELDLKLDSQLRKDETRAPFGQGSTHTTTARWVASQLLPSVQWFNNGTICEGANVTFP